MWAAKRGKIFALKTLAKLGANLVIADSQGMTPLDQAIINGNYQNAIYLKRKVFK